MKRIVDGKTYNTDTATKIAGARIESGDEDFTNLTLYVTRGGAFFIHEFERLTDRHLVSVHVLG